jgi:hypothetical protein
MVLKSEDGFAYFVNLYPGIICVNKNEYFIFIILIYQKYVVYSASSSLEIAFEVDGVQSNNITILVSIDENIPHTLCANVNVLQFPTNIHILICCINDTLLI